MEQLKQFFFCRFGCLSNQVILIAIVGRTLLLFCYALRYFNFLFCFLYVCEKYNHNLIEKEMRQKKTKITVLTIATYS